MTLLKELIQKSFKAYKRQKAWKSIDGSVKPLPGRRKFVLGDVTRKSRRRGSD